MIKLITFDWNGTLFDDTHTIEAADNKVLGHFNFPPITIKKFQETFDVPIIKYWTALGFSRQMFKKSAKQIDFYFQKYYEPMADKCRARAGSREVLRWLKLQNIKSIIYSNHTTPNIERQLKRLKIGGLIDGILARTLGDISHMHSRGKEQKLAGYVKKHKLKAHEVVSVGDTEEEIEIGKKYGFHTVSLTGGYNTTSRLKKHKPDFLIHNMRELIAIVKKLNHG